MTRNSHNVPEKKPTRQRGRFVSFTTLGVVLLLSLLGWWAWGILTPKPLGDRVEYIGKESYGCYLICDSSPTTIYYYATSLTAEEVGSYFEKATLSKPAEKTSAFSLLSLEDKTIHKSFIIYYYDHEQSKTIQHNKPAKATLGISDRSYQLAKNAL